MNGPASSASRARRELTVAVLGSALAGGLALSTAGQGWADVTIVREPPLPPVDAVLTGSDAAPLVAACGLLLLAAAVAVIAVRGAARVLVGGLVALAGGAVVWSTAQAVRGGLSEVSTELPGVGRGGGPVTVDVAAGWPALAVAAGVLAVLVGLLVALRGRSWPGMGRRYERTAPGAPPARQARPATDEDRHQAAWKALDRGEDPTV
ncbi:Trp biosynthesis-associated membrane protein [Modestobacter roseus]|uniref:Putative membrane protein (TIGR02234 family) n=1 Tax=Modestobacter roseus TaxID=1181884 RepID=A0A562IN31_9ACTN|nr:Trp biosynthesis-associated membrane protein [Modestobacter roseus]MQA34998.1 TIGR02234 family membrane protein [Modestobacter roseus]TWH72429.1 putative membrane protein (TIGR02234 family) [Modestobacter roseus]